MRKLIEFGACAVLPTSGEHGRIGQAQSRRGLQYQPLGLAQAGSAVKSPHESHVDGELVELVSERTGVVGVEHQEIEERLRAGRATGSGGGR